VEACLAQRQSYEVKAAAAADGVVLVRFTLSPGACIHEGPVLDMGATYAVDTRQGRILAIQRP
jgi:hypothetical protein